MDNGTETTKLPEGTVILTDSFKKITRFKKDMEVLSKDDAQTPELRRYARALLHPINALIAQAMSELAG